MTLAQYEQFSNYAVASATGILALAFVAYVLQWSLARGVAPDRELVLPDGEPAASGTADPVQRSNVAGSIGFSLTQLAAVVLLAGVVARGLSAERVPWGNMYEFGCAAALSAIIGYIVLVRIWDIDWVGPIITGFATVVLGASALVFVPAGPLVPALHSYWLVIHVLGAMISGAAFLVGAAASVLYLIKAKAERTTPEGERTGFLWRIPTAAKIDQLAYRVHAFAFPIWTFAALIAGPIWAQYAWGRYWGWDPKEVWAFITWVVYAGYLHARATAGWKGKAAAILALIGFVTFVFNFVGVNLFVGGLHSYAK
ncbi:c-type cytochrome biogenesis protein CcsB [Aeromicrobium chenweiae]|uniref:C-type cytochrome biogenesis protein CcsB n=1 Tax=Aeromicrobium chenweiae TaxID=2079793 RepID=A0A2S0WQP3_9ACTN|nr:c-type cytochrome biogenesis protein CcsB [Aeromicrobium chenweiae]AWB93544.1 c-type cytochrome biogenesis protein CcsB [Aeromicrobium chenweiae]TGN33193.1 c-type cytochrome biogenesis protein CcsB [Aeromicrobium chenweiae]